MSTNGRTTGSISRDRSLGSFLWSGLALLGVVALCYFNSLQASWQYDDFPNIVNNPAIQVTQWTWPQIKSSLSAGLDHQVISRPLAYLSFALNHRLGATHVTGYHMVNIGIHWLSTVFLFLFIREILLLPLNNGRYDAYADITALIAAILWSTHPIQVSAVTFVVQRMASMAGLFYVMTMFFYIKGRMAAHKKSRIGYFTLGSITALCALLTKENAVLVFYAIWFLDLLLIQGCNRQNITKNLIWATCLTVGIAMVGLLYVDPRNLFQHFDIRPFTWLERLLTQPRVIFFYLALIAVPMNSRMSLIHDFEISSSLWVPWTTGFAIIGMILVIAMLVLMSRRYPLFALCGIFFFLNHSIEGSIFNLELVYEHRNYIPTMLLFVPIAIAVVNSTRFFVYARWIQAMIAGVLILMVASQVHTTLSYNRIFRTNLSLWTDVVQKFPRLSLGHLNLGKVLWEGGHFEAAGEEFRTALELDRFHHAHHRAMVLYNLGLYETSIQKNHTAAEIRFKEAQIVFSDLGFSKKIARTWMESGEYQRALDEMLKARGLWGEDLEMLKMMGIAYLKDGRPDMSLKYAQTVLQKDQNDPVALMVAAQSQRLHSRGSIALTYLERILTADPSHVGVILAMIEICDELGRHERIEELIKRLGALEKPRRLKAMDSVLPQEAKDSLVKDRKAAMMPYVPDLERLGRLFKIFRLSKPENG